MTKIWDIKLYLTKRGYKVKIEGADPTIGYWQSAVGEGPTAHKAYQAAEIKLVVKPWLVSLDDYTVLEKQAPKVADGQF